MYSNNNIPYYGINIPNRRSFGFRNRNDRLFGGGFAVPFLLGGITGGLLARPNNFYGGFQPYPVPFIVNPGFSNFSTYPSYTENYYYY